MLDALGSPQSVLVFGGTSEIAQATLAEFARGGRLRRVVLAARRSPRREVAAASVAALPGVSADIVTAVDFDAAATEEHAALVNAVFDEGDIDVAIVAFGVLPNGEASLNPHLAAAVVTSNFGGAVSVLTATATRMKGQGHGVIVVLSSVAGERPRKSNYLYGSTKAGLDAFATGLADDLHGSGVTVLVVRPGFVRTAMTRGMKEAPLAVDACDVARAIAGSVRGPSRTIWTPYALRPVMAVLRHVPRPLFRRLPI